MKEKSVWEYINNQLAENGAIHFTLIDPDPLKQTPEEASNIAKIAEKAGTSAIMVGGSTAFDIIDKTVIEIKNKVRIPVILFPGNVNGISKYADAIFFMSLINSRNHYWIIDAQMLASMAIKRFNLEPLSMAYLIVEPGATAGFVGDARLIPRNKPLIAAAYALAAEYFGFKLVYMEAGSGASEAITPEFVKVVKKVISIPLIVGGGIRTIERAKELVRAGADILVQGTFIEKNAKTEEGFTAIKNIIAAIHEEGKRR